MTSQSTPATRRFDAIAKIANAVTDTTSAAEFAVLADEMVSISSLGRTDRWKKACAFAADEIMAAQEAGNLTREHARWAVLQGSVWMGYAAE
jgi:hypothetical protein